MVANTVTKIDILARRERRGFHRGWNTQTGWECGFKTCARHRSPAPSPLPPLVS